MMASFDTRSAGDCVQIRTRRPAGPGLSPAPGTGMRTGLAPAAVALVALAALPLLAARPAFALPAGYPAPLRLEPILTPVAVFGADDRVVLPARLKALESKIGLIYEPRSRSVCTAFCLDTTIIATAAHCLFRTRGERALPLANVTFRLASQRRRAGTPLAGAQNGAAAQHVIAGSTSLSTRPPIDATHDWALLRLARPACSAGGLPLSVRPPAELAATDPDPEPMVYQVGFHGDFGHWRLTLSPPCSVRRSAAGPQGRAVAEDFDDASTLILHRCDTGGASSGSPLLIDGPRGPEVVGINVGTYLQSRVLTQAGEVVHRYKSDTIANTAVSTLAFLAQRRALDTATVITDRTGIRRIQTVLAAAGHYRGAIDGRYGNGLRQAIESFEKSERRLPTGLASSDLLRRLNAVMAELEPQNATAIETGSVPPRPVEKR